MTDLLQRLQHALADHYTIERKIVSGGMAAVYLADNLKHRTPPPSDSLPSITDKSRPSAILAVSTYGSVGHLSQDRRQPLPLMQVRRVLGIAPNAC